MTGTRTDYEYGYRLADGREVWQVEHGSDGAWIPNDPQSGVGVIDVWWADEDSPTQIRDALKGAGVVGVVLRRPVTTQTGPVEEVPE